MSELLFLTTGDFTLTKTAKSNTLGISLKGFALIMFYSKQCEHCKNLFPVFKKLPGTVGGCQFGIVNVNNNKELIARSSDTSTPIKYVPYIILYINGKPFMKYQGPSQVDKISQFIVEVSKKVNARQKFTEDNETIKKPKGRIPEYCIGEPLFGIGNVSYIEFKDL